MITRFIKWLTEQVGSIYVWGAQGEVGFDEAWIRKRETSETNANRAIAFYQKQKVAGVSPIAAYDCSGLIVRFLLDNGFLKKDITSHGIYNLCKKINADKLQTGDFVFRHNGIKIYHVGVYVGDGFVIHAKGRDAGVVKENININGSTYWNRFGRYEALTEQVAKEGKCKMELNILRNGNRGSDVRALQILLNGYGYNCGKTDGVFGSNTLEAAKKFQKKEKLAVDGIVGQQTWSILLKGGK